MLLEKSPHGAVLSTFYELDAFKSVIKSTLLPQLHEIDKNIRITFSEGEFDMYLYIEGWEYEEDPEPHSQSTMDKLRKIGFSTSGGENLEVAFSMISPGRNVSYTMDSRMGGIILEYGGEGTAIASELEALFNNIDNLDRNETANQIGLIYKKIKDMRWL